MQVQATHRDPSGDAVKNSLTPALKNLAVQQWGVVVTGALKAYFSSQFF